MFRKILVTIILVTVLCIHPAHATPPSNPHIDSGSAAEGGNYFEYNASYNGSSGWKDLKTPPHWVVETGEIAYCLEHMEDSPHGDSYTPFNPTTVYSNRTYKGILAILEHSFPYRNPGLPDSEIRYATANAIRSWIKESAGVGYEFMLPSNKAVKAKSSAYQSAFNFYKQLLDKARNALIIKHELTAHPSTIELKVQGDKLIGKTTIRYPALNGKYKINADKLPVGVKISGYAGNNGEVLTITAPLSMIGETINLDKVLTGYDNRCPENISWLDNNSGHQAVAVSIVEKMTPVVTTSITLKSTPSTVTVIKHVEKDTLLLSGAVFGVYKASDNTLVDQLTTGSNGKATSGNLKLGEYYLEEITSPEGYVLDSTKHPFSITTTNRQVTLDINNSPIKGRVSIYKTDEESNPLQGVVFGLYGADNNLIQELVTNAEGKVTSYELFYGDYYIKELSTLEGYNLDNTPKPFKIVDNNQVVEMKLVNKVIRGKVKIITKDEENKPLEGAVYSVFDNNEILVDDMTTNKDGVALSGDLRYGEYYLKEKSPPIGYLNNDSTILFKIVNQDEVVELSTTNARIHGRVQIKTVGESNNPLNGVVIGVYTTEDKLIEELTTDENGSVVSKELYYGDYYTQEIKSLEGYVLDDTKHNFTIMNNDEMVSVEILNKLIRGQVEVDLTDTETDKPLSGAVFGIYNTNGELIEEIITDDNGRVLSNQLIYGEYYLKELQAQAGYNIDNEIHSFSIDTNEQIIHFDIKNSVIKGSVVITNTSASDGASIQGSVFALYKKDGSYITELTANKNGVVTIDSLTYGEYYLQEKNVSYGYVIDDIKHPLSIIQDNKIVEVNILNHPIVGSVEVYFRDIRHGHEIYKPYSYTDWIGRDYMNWIIENGLDKNNIEGYKFVKVDYPAQKELIDEKLIITYWYDGLS